jgi:hypothetical protein
MPSKSRLHAVACRRRASPLDACAPQSIACCFRCRVACAEYTLLLQHTLLYCYALKQHGILEYTLPLIQGRAGTLNEPAPLNNPLFSVLPPPCTLE